MWRTDGRWERMEKELHQERRKKLVRQMATSEDIQGRLGKPQKNRSSTNVQAIKRGEGAIKKKNIFFEKLKKVVNIRFRLF